MTFQYSVKFEDSEAIGQQVLIKDSQDKDSLGALSPNEVSLYFCFLMGYHPVLAAPPSHPRRAHILILYCSSKWGFS